MRSFTGHLAIIPLLSILVSCSTILKNSDGGSTYYDSAFDDKNRAPASLVPPEPSSMTSTNLDPVHLRTQADYQFSVAEALSLEGQSQGAIEHYKLALVYDQTAPTINLRLASEYLKAGLISEAVIQAEEAISKKSNYLEAHLLLGGLYSTMKSYAKAHEQYGKVLKIDPSNLEAPLYIGAIYSEQGQPDKAVKYFESLAKNPNYTTPYLAWYYIGRVLADQNKGKLSKPAEDAFLKSLNLKPDFVDSLMSLGGMYTASNDQPKAIVAYRKFQKENGPNSRVAEVLAQIYVEAEDYDNAYEQMSYIEDSGDGGLNVKMKMALILIEQKKYPTAIAKLESILLDVPDSDKVRFYLAAVYEESGLYELAISNFKKVIPGSQFYSESVVHAAYLLKGAHKANQALELISAAVKVKRDNPQLYAMYGSLLDDAGKYNEAIKILDEGLQLFPDHAQLRFYYGIMHDKIGKKEVVIREMKKVIEIDPDHVQGLNYLAFTYAEVGVNLKEAEAFARKAHHLDPKDGYVLDTLGWILYKQGRFVDAIKTLEAAFGYQNGVSVIAEHLGDAYLKQALVEKAKQMYKHAESLETDKEKINEIRSKISAIERQILQVSERVPASIGSK